MKKGKVLLTAFLFLLFAETSFATGISPIVDTGPNGSRAVKLEVGNTLGDYSLMWIDLGSVSPVDHNSITVGFDIYRYGTANINYEGLIWGWGNLDDYTLDNIDPNNGGQYVRSAGGPFETFPFVGHDSSGYTNSVVDQYASLTLTWDFTNQECLSTYNSLPIDTGGYENVFTDDTVLHGFLFELYNSSGGTDGEVVWIDNFFITGSDIYNSNGFDNFNPGLLNGQDGWVGETESAPVPEPATILLFALGLLGLAKGSRRTK